MASYTITLEDWEIELLRKESTLRFVVNGDQVTFPKQARHPLAKHLEQVLDFGEISAYEALEGAEDQEEYTETED